MYIVAIQILRIRNVLPLRLQLKLDSVIHWFTDSRICHAHHVAKSLNDVHGQRGRVCRFPCSQHYAPCLCLHQLHPAENVAGFVAFVTWLHGFCVVAACSPCPAHLCKLTLTGSRKQRIDLCVCVRSFKAKSCSCFCIQRADKRSIY